MSAFLESQFAGVLLGAVVALAATLFTDWLRTKREDQRRADDVRSATHVDALRAAYVLRDAAIKLSIVSGHTDGLSRAKRESLREDAYNRFDLAGHEVGKQLQVVLALGHPAVAAALSMVGDCAHDLMVDRQPDEGGVAPTFDDLDECIAILAAATRTEARTDEFIRNGGNLQADTSFGGRRTPKA